MVDAGYDLPRLAFGLADLPVQVLGRMRSDRVLYFPAPERRPGADGRPPRHGPEFRSADGATWPAPQVTTTTDTARYGAAVATAWDRLHPRLTHRSAWEDSAREDYAGELPVVEGTVIRLRVDRLPSGAAPKPVWLWWSRTGATAADVDRCWQAFLRRFDLEHTFGCASRSWAGPRRSCAGPGSRAGAEGAAGRVGGSLFLMAEEGVHGDEVRLAVQP